MFGLIDKVYDRLFEHDSPDRLRRWRETVAQLILLDTIAVLILSCAVSIGLPLLGALAWARDVGGIVERELAAQAQPIVAKEVAVQLAAAIDELTIQLAAAQAQLQEAERQREDLEAKVDALGKMMRDSAADDYAGRIVEYKAQQCKASDLQARATWRDMVIAFQEKYETVKGRRFDTPGCQEL